MSAGVFVVDMVHTMMLEAYFDIEERGLNFELICCSCGQNWLMRKTPQQPDNADWLLKHAELCRAYNIRVVNP